jgi:hypothetical protein
MRALDWADGRLPMAPDRIGGRPEHPMPLILVVKGRYLMICGFTLEGFNVETLN